jgi:hypothetical protein
LLFSIHYPSSLNPPCQLSSVAVVLEPSVNREYKLLKW